MSIDSSEPPEEMTREHFLSVLINGGTQSATRALVEILHTDGDPYWLESQCLRLLDYPDPAVRHVAVIGFSTIARLHGISSPKVTRRLKQLLLDSELFGDAQVVLEDLAVFQSSKMRRWALNRRNAYWEWNARRLRRRRATAHDAPSS